MKAMTRIKKLISLFFKEPAVYVSTSGLHGPWTRVQIEGALQTLESGTGIKPGRRQVKVADDLVGLVIKCRVCGTVYEGRHVGIAKLKHPDRAVLRHMQKQGWRWIGGRGKSGWLCPADAGR